MYKLIGIVGSNAKSSTNRMLLQYMKKAFADKATIELLEIDAFPLFNKPAFDQLPPVVIEVAAKIEQAQGVIISTPEYDHTIPAALNNALAWLSYGIYPFVDKPVMITGASYGVLGSSRAQQHLRQILDAPELKARIMPSSEFLLGHSLKAFDETGNLVNAENKIKLSKLFDEYLSFINVMEKVTQATSVHRKEAENYNWEKREVN
ncbi:NADPH-dependent FMN reductase [Globicatella sanguinis]|nr:NADPH-dependent FMN reductase [Globicatella sanguinis]MDK7630093.1 NADPH-dependent FMN reductase [Globicatella sanguinis]WIK65552.1 NADPH-dependent FMN reductase [Globicatella sanguinis]WKT54957.1 NADPH-dependent FMN reductase [Globicatella sanguinis]